MDVNLKKDALQLCQQFLGGPWKLTNLEEFRFSSVSGGLSNTLYYCALPPEKVAKDVPKDALLRIYGPIQEDPHVVITEAATFTLLSERNLGPKLYGIFLKGRLEEFIPSRSLDTGDIRRLSTTIARELAKIHALRVPVRKIPDVWYSSLNKWIEDIQNHPAGMSEETVPLMDVYRKEIDWMWKEMLKSDSPVVYCHNDLQGGNILLRNDSEKLAEPKLMLIDFEFGGYNYRGFDIANQFCEWCFDYNTKEYPHFVVDFDKFPSRDEQIEYIVAYLEQLKTEGISLNKSLQQETEQILEEVKLFVMPAHLMWSLWSIKMSQMSEMGFAHLEHGRTRRKAYHMYKEIYVKSSQISNGEGS